MTFDLQLARQCLRFSRRAYDEATIRDAATSTEVLLGGLVDQPDTLVIAFRGSREPRDFIMDAKFIVKSEWPFGGYEESDTLVHRGFAQGLFAVGVQLVERAKSFKRIICTGHSLGGARAILAALYLDEQGFDVTDVITFGAPRVGNGAFRDYYDEELHDITLRFEAQGDPVPWTPPWLLNGYRHVGRSAYLKNDGSVSVDPALWQHAPAFAQTFGKLESSRGSNLLGVFNPHKIENYERLFQKMGGES